MRRLEWGPHNTVELTECIPEEWHEIATAPRRAAPRAPRRVGEGEREGQPRAGGGYGPRVNDGLKSYMHARLEGVIRGAETLAHSREREEAHAGP